MKKAKLFPAPFSPKVVYRSEYFGLRIVLMIPPVLRLGISTSKPFGDKAVLNLSCDHILLLYVIPSLKSNAANTKFIFF